MLDEGVEDGTSAGILDWFGLPADWLMRASRALLEAVTPSGDPPVLGATLVLAAVLLRLAALPLLARALPGRRLNAVCAPVVRAVRERHPGDRAAQALARGDLLARFRFPSRIAHTAVTVVAVNGTACVLWAAHLQGDGSPYTATVWTLGGTGTGTGTAAGAGAGGGWSWWEVLAAIVLAALAWYHQWYTDERRILTHLMPERVWEEQFAARSRLVTAALPLAWALVLLPLGALVFLLAWQLSGRIPHHLLTARAGRVPAPAELWDAYMPMAPPAAVPTPAPAPVPAPRTPEVPGIVVPPPRVEPLGGRDPRSIGEYQLLGRLGRGGMGTVYLAHREGSATHVALKAVHSDLVGDPDLVRRFEREAEVLKLVDGAFTARILDTGLDGTLPYIIMELLDGLPLDRYVVEQRLIEEPAALRALGIAVAEALRGLHERGIVHRDIKPSNIMLTSGGPKVVDFGIVRVLSSTRHTPADQAMGTLAYMAPEQYDPKIPVGPAADVWAWACTLVHAATGESPFDSPDLPAVMNAVLERGPDTRLLARVHEIDPDLGAIVTAALTRDAAARPADGADLLTRLSPEGTDSHTVISKVTAAWTALR